MAIATWIGVVIAGALGVWGIRQAAKANEHSAEAAAGRLTLSRTGSVHVE